MAGRPIPSKEYLIWLAGFFDGEGSIGIGRRNNRQNGKAFNLFCCVVQADPTELYLIQHYFGGTVYKTRGGYSRKAIYRWSAGARIAYNMVKEIYPHLRCKKRQAEIVLIFQEEVIKKGRKRLTKENEAFFSACFKECSDLKMNKNEILEDKRRIIQ